MANGFFKPGLSGEIVGGSERVVFLGPDANMKEVVLPEFAILIDGAKSPREFCQYGRDFVFAG